MRRGSKCIMADSSNFGSQVILRPFLILASLRSGSSLLRSLLNEHSNIVVPPECGYIQWLGLKYCGRPVHPKRFVSDLKKCKKIEGWQLRILHSRARCPAGHVILL